MQIKFVLLFVMPIQTTYAYMPRPYMPICLYRPHIIQFVNHRPISPTEVDITKKVNEFRCLRVMIPFIDSDLKDLKGC